MKNNEKRDGVSQNVTFHTPSNDEIYVWNQRSLDKIDFWVKNAWSFTVLFIKMK